MSHGPDYDEQGRSVEAMSAMAEKRNTRPSGWKPKSRSKYVPHIGAKEIAKAKNKKVRS